jgi:hypothetical protein
LTWHYKFFIWPLIVVGATWAAFRGPWSDFERYGAIAACMFLWFYTLTVSYRVETLGSTITFFRLIGRKTIEAEDITNVEDSLCSIKVIYRGGQVRVTNLLQNFSALMTFLRSFKLSMEPTVKDDDYSYRESPQPRNLGIDHFKQLPKGNIRRNNNYYGLALLALMFVGIGSIMAKTARVTYRGYLVFEGQPAVLFGTFLIAFGLYFLYYLLFIAKAEEMKLGEFHELEDFDDIIDGYKTKFHIENTATVAGTSCISVFYYILEIRFNNELNIGFDIKQRDRVEHLLWLIGVTRFLDVHTYNRHFDSHYRVKCSNPNMFRTKFGSYVISMLEEFDRSYPPIRKKNGILHITDAGIRYVEGPYGEEQRLFDPHRGKIEDLFRELIKIMREIEK